MEPGDIVYHSPSQHHEALRVDDECEAVLLEKGIREEVRLVKSEGILEAGTAAGLDPYPQPFRLMVRMFLAVLLEELLGLGRGRLCDADLPF